MPVKATVLTGPSREPCTEPGIVSDVGRNNKVSLVTPDTARRAMVEQLSQSRVLATPEIKHALLAVPRHLFLPEINPSDAYADRAVIIKRDPTGIGLSSASETTIVAAMLEMLQASPGQQVLEIGTGTGYNAALLSFLVGDEGAVVTVELDEDLGERAVAALARAGIGHVQVVIGDGSNGFAAGAPYERVIVTTGAREVSEAWRTQLAEGGRLVTPIVDEGGVGRIRTFDKISGRMTLRSERPCGFLPMR